MEKTTFSRERLRNFLAQLEVSSGGYLTVYIKPFSSSPYATELAAELHPFAEEVKEAFSIEAVLHEAERYGTGAVIFWGESGNKRIILPPFPIPEDKIVKGGPETSLLRQLLEKERIIGLVLVTWGSYAIGVLKSDKLLQSKTGTGYIHKPHRKGGRSEKRFARRTEEQKKDFLRKVAKRVEEGFKGYGPEQIFFGGNRLILKPLLEECPYLESKVQHISKRFLNVRYADREALHRSLEDVYKSLIFNY